MAYNNILAKFLLLFTLTIFLSSCGVKGDLKLPNEAKLNDKKTTDKK